MDPVPKSSKRRHKAKPAKAPPISSVMGDPSVTGGKENGPNCHLARPTIETDSLRSVPCAAGVTEISPAKDTAHKCVASRDVANVVEDSRSVVSSTTEAKPEVSTKPDRDMKLSANQPTLEKSDKEIPTRMLDSNSRNVPSCNDSVAQTSGNTGKPEATRNKPDNAASVTGTKSPQKKEAKGVTTDGPAAEASDAAAQKSKADLRRERREIQVCVLNNLEILRCLNSLFHAMRSVSWYN